MERDDHRKNASEGDIKVTDRRKFTREGERVSPDDVSRNSTQETTEESNSEASTREETSPNEEPSADLFVTHIMALSQLGMIHLGHIENPATHKAEADLPAAREVIDLLGMLREKTQGNLTPEEQNLLDTWLYQLRMAFTQVAGTR
jgi:hypothetical protein